MRLPHKSLVFHTNSICAVTRTGHSFMRGACIHDYRCRAEPFLLQGPNMNGPVARPTSRGNFLIQKTSKRSVRSLHATGSFMVGPCSMLLDNVALRFVSILPTTLLALRVHSIHYSACVRLSNDTKTSKISPQSLPNVHGVCIKINTAGSDVTMRQYSQVVTGSNVAFQLVTHVTCGDILGCAERLCSKAEKDGCSCSHIRCGQQSAPAVRAEKYA
jgi:hypothetical protein